MVNRCNTRLNVLKEKGVKLPKLMFAQKVRVERGELPASKRDQPPKDRVKTISGFDSARMGLCLMLDESSRTNSPPRPLEKTNAVKMRRVVIAAVCFSISLI